MIKCPNCFYQLVFLEHRRKYKCAKCSRIFLQTSTELAEFKSWNVKQREVDAHNLSVETRKVKLTEEEKKARRKQWRLNNLEKCRENSEKYYEINKEAILSKKKLYRQLTKKKSNSWRRNYRKEFAEFTRLQSRIDYWKQRQKALAEQISENKLYKAYNDKIAHSVLTFLLCEQLAI